MNRSKAQAFMRKVFKDDIGLGGYGACKSKDVEAWLGRISRRAVSGSNIEEIADVNNGKLPDCFTVAKLRE